MSPHMPTHCRSALSANSRLQPMRGQQAARGRAGTLATINTTLTPQARMDAAFDNYFAHSDVLRSDLIALLDSESASQHWRRNCIRVSASLIEGYAHCEIDPNSFKLLVAALALMLHLGLLSPRLVVRFNHLHFGTSRCR